MSAHLTPEQLETPAEHAAHLESCAQCRDAVRLAGGRAKLLAGMKPYTLADVAFSRVEARLMEHVRENPPGPRWTFGRLLALGVLATVAGLFAITTVQPLFQNKVEPVASVNVVAEYEPMTVVHAFGAVAVKAGDVLGKGTTLDATKGRVVLSTADGAALRLSGGAKVVLGVTGAFAQVSQGALQVDAKKRGPWAISTGTHWVKSSDATFEIASDQLKVFRGSVLLADNASFTSARQVNAPTAVMLHGGATGTLSGTMGLRDTPPPPWARLELGLDATEVELDGQKVGGSPLSLLSSPGKHKLRALVGDQWRDGDIELTTSGSGVVTLPEKTAAMAPMPTGPVVEADPLAIASAVKAQLPKLRVCHEKWLKVNESARGKVMMTVTVSPKGRVTRAAFSADEGVPETVNECLGRAVRAMKLPTSSEEVELEIPLVLGGEN